MARATVAEQFTLVSTPMKLRVATRPSSRRMPMKVAGSSTKSVGCTIDAELVLARELGHAEILRVHVLAARDRLARHADDLVVALDRLALRDVARRDLVARRNQPGDDEIFRRDARAGHQLARRDHDVVVGMQPNDCMIGG